MTTMRGLTQAIYYFYRQLGVTDVKVKCSTEFCHWYYKDEEESQSYIEYTLRAPKEDVILGYGDYMAKYHPEMKDYSLNFFTFSLLHELGHHLTIFTANPASLAKSRKAIRNLSQKNMTPRKIQARYCELYVEKLANEKAIELIKNNYEIIQNFEKRLEKLVA